MAQRGLWGIGFVNGDGGWIEDRLIGDGDEGGGIEKYIFLGRFLVVVRITYRNPDDYSTVQ